jgi:uncharacterized protein with LGFP repeats
LPSLLVRALLVAIVLTLVSPVGQVRVHASPVTQAETIDDLPEEAEPAAEQPAPTAPASRSESVEPALTFNAVGVTTANPGIARVTVRTSLDGETWSPWEELEFLDEDDGPDDGTDAAATQIAERATDPLWVGEASHLQVEVVGGEVADLEVTVIDSMGSSGGPVQRHWQTTSPAAEASSGINVISRAQWGADESLRTWKPSYASQIHMGVVHHTAHTTSTSANTYSQAEAAGIMRAMYRYHAVTLGWGDIGYNVVVDRFGNVYEGRAGGFESSVIGAHARNFNTGSFGVSVMGNFTTVQPSDAAIAALTRVIGVKSAIHGVDPTGWTDRMSGGTWRPTIVGHRDVGQTACPGLIQQRLPTIRQNARAFAVRFPDVPSSSPHRPAILALADAGVTNGCSANAFCPKNELTRGQASSFVMRGLQLQPISGQRFSDVPGSYVHAPAINALAQRGWLIGYDDGRFRPNERMTRGQLATLLARSLDLRPSSGATNPYPDVPASHPHRDGIVALSEVGIRGDCGGGSFCPNDVVLRDSTASFVKMILDHRAKR